MQTYLLMFSLHMLMTGTHGIWCNSKTGGQNCILGCCGTYWNRTCCTALETFCNINGEIIYCPAGCCGVIHFNRTCCPVTTVKPTTRNTTTWWPTTRYPTWPPTTRYPTWRPTTRYPTWPPTTRYPDTDGPNNGVWCSYKGGRMYCRYGCCGTNDARSCCSSTEWPDVTSNPQAFKVSTHTIIVIVVSCLAAITGVITILVGVYCCLRTGQGARGQTLHPAISTVSPNIQAGVHSTGPVTAGAPGAIGFSNQIYMATPVIHSQQESIADTERN